jgi:thiamine-phosphate pyrophosphorylase
MPLDLPRPIIYLITSGASTDKTTPEDGEFSSILKLLEVAVATEIPLFQIREKDLSARVLYELTTSAGQIVRGTKTRLLINDRADIARAAGADGVHLTSQSLTADVIRHMFGNDFLIGVSTHSVEDVRAARDNAADFVVFGPVFETDSKKGFGKPQGLEKLGEVTQESGKLPVLAIGGITLERVDACFQAGARGIAAIRLLNDATGLSGTVMEIKSRFRIFES